MGGTRFFELGSSERAGKAEGIGKEKQNKIVVIGLSTKEN